MVDIARDARWGRMAEGAGEDPFLGAAMAAAYVRGYQGSRLDALDSIAACAKHYVGYGAAEGGRDYNTTEISEHTLRQFYLPPFAAAVEAGTASLMSAFNSLNGVPVSASPFTLKQVLRQEWGFRGLVVSDWSSIGELVAHGIAEIVIASGQVDAILQTAGLVGHRLLPQGDRRAKGFLRLRQLLPVAQQGAQVVERVRQLSPIGGLAREVSGYLFE